VKENGAWLLLIDHPETAQLAGATIEWIPSDRAFVLRDKNMKLMKKYEIDIANKPSEVTR
jgi:hypothetical protein